MLIYIEYAPIVRKGITTAASFLAKITGALGNSVLNKLEGRRSFVLRYPNYYSIPMQPIPMSEIYRLGLLAFSENHDRSPLGLV